MQTMICHFFLQLDIKAAPAVAGAITSIVLWDGPPGVIGDFNEPIPEDWIATLCLCCFDDPIDEVSLLFNRSRK